MTETPDDDRVDDEEDLDERGPSGLEAAVVDAFERAQVSLDPADWRLYHALSGALDAERHPPPEPASTEGIPDPPISNIKIPPG
jgi:hypothetical protein